MKKSDIIIDKAFTTVANVPLVKQCAADFCARYTDGDIIRALVKTAGECGKPEYIEGNPDMLFFCADIYCGAPICATEKDVRLCIRAYLYSLSSVFKVTAYCDMDLTFSDELTSIERFDRVRN